MVISTARLVIALVLVTVSCGRDDLPGSASVPSEAVPVGVEALTTPELVAVADVRPGDELFSLPAGGGLVLVRVRAGEPTLLFGTSCDVVSAVPLPSGWQGVCLEYTSQGQRIVGMFPYGTTSEHGLPETPTTLVIGESSLVVVPDQLGGVPPDLEIGCMGGGPFFPASALGSVEPLVGSGRDAIENAIAWFLESGEGASWAAPAAEWQVLYETDEEVLLVFVDPSVPAIGFQEVQLVEGVWTWAGSSLGESCPLQASLPDGLNHVTWRIDPGYRLDAASTAIHLVARENECVSGHAMGERFQPPNVVITGTEVRITLVAVPPPGDIQLCPGNPEQPVTVQLGLALGDREVVDGLSVLGDLVDLIAPVE